ncbi:hypothetical protein SERLA73DRAFT_76223 [Serpula lacrymans var. lacrymans S7.3]|uniref:Phosphatidylinositol-specific phospholipase C X domain-containing protein n=2 Tax=Serpula lacrymans var. lacrymans TaxID=341189 RepID=F8Q6K6_SERL3|nr:uncharacterized protein SERLADRAFT_441016 [Serpula lacrymans var. lacrymans S7.9]EGN96244.1 hypothetical protein SERLA73DRAFT_76223 [Serpula lacrymans var. lacrymans S7.3]EGO21783.1 hypothetical protein SERLADRAFT_441016 [Serpula lacrymans var. lacrymans S7.9]
MALGAQWQAIKTPRDCAWRIYRSKITRKHHRLLIIPRRDTSNFLSEIPDTVPLSSLLLPGTHDTMAFYGWPVSQCQSLGTPLDAQLRAGIRVLDIRLSIIDSRLLAYHGAYPQRTPFRDILTTLYDFLNGQSTCYETIVVSIKQEDKGGELFSKLVREEIMASPGGIELWYLENRIPTLGEVRGKAVMFSRFGGNGFGWDGGALGIHPSIWPDSEKVGFSWNCQNTLVQTHDWYAIPLFLAIPEKVSLSTGILLSSSDNPPMPTLSISFFSASSFPLAFPPTIARGFGWPKVGFGFEGVNGRVGKWLLDTLGESVGGLTEKGSDSQPRIRGWTFMDFYEDPIVAGVMPLLIECNFRGRRSGQEGWP